MPDVLVDSAPGYEHSAPTRSDTLRLVRFVAPDFEAARPIVLAELTSDVRHIADGGSPQFAPGDRERGNITLDSPYAGEIATLDRHKNARFTVTLRTMAADPVADMDALVAQLITAPARSAIEWRRDGTSLPSYYPLRFDAEWSPTYRLRERRQRAGMTVALNIEVAPYVHRGSMDIAEDFATLDDWTYDQGAGTLSAVGGQLAPSSTAAKRLWHSTRGYRYGDAQATLALQVGATTSTIAEVVLSRQDATTALLLGVNAGTLRISRRVAGTTTVLATTAAILTASTAYWVRGRREGDVLIAELFTAAPSPMAAPAVTVTHTLSGGDIAAFADEGDIGLHWAPGATGERINAFTVQAYAYRNRTLPQMIALGTVPGDLPALCDLTVTPSGGSAAPIAGLFGWARTPTTPAYGVPPFGILEGEAMTITDTFSVIAESSEPGPARGGNYANTATTSAIWWGVDADTLEPDNDGSLTVEVFARIAYNHTHAGSWVLFADPRDGTSYGARRYGDRGTAGILPRARLVSGGAPFYSWRMVRLGRIRLTGQQRLGVSVTLNGGSTGVGIDYLVLVPARSFVASPMGVAVDSGYPKLAPSTAETVRTLQADGTATINAPGQTPMAEHGMGRRIELPPGDVSLVAKLSSLAVDRAEVDTASEQLGHAASVQARVLPRYAFA
jgi:hypothetical protein